MGSVFFFYPREKKLNPRKFSIFCPRCFQTGREKNLENSPRNIIVPEKKTAKFNPRKKNLPREKNAKFCPRKCQRNKKRKNTKTITPAEKILPEKKKSARE